MNDALENESAGNLRDRLEGLEFSVRIARRLAEVSPERVDLEERIARMEAEIKEVIDHLRSGDDRPGGSGV